MCINYKMVFIFFVTTFLTSCSNSSIKSDIANAYLILGKKYDEEIIVQDVYVLEYKEVDFESFANEEAFRLKTLNDLILEQIQITDSIQLVIQNVIETKNCFFGISDDYYTLKRDSALLEETIKKGQILKLKELDNRAKIINILSLSESKGIANTKNYYVLHEINLMIDHKKIKDTTKFISLGNDQFNYLKKNIVIDNK